MVALRALIETTVRELKRNVGYIVSIPSTCTKSAQVAILVYATTDGKKYELNSAIWDLGTSKQSIWDRLTSCSSGIRAILRENIGPFGAEQTVALNLSRNPAVEFLLLSGVDLASTEQDKAVIAELARAAEGVFERYSMCAFAAGGDVQTHWLGLSERFIKLHTELKRVARHPNAPVLIVGERGSGNEEPPTQSITSVHAEIIRSYLSMPACFTPNCTPAISSARARVRLRGFRGAQGKV